MENVSPYSVQMQENADQNNSEDGHFSCSVDYFLWSSKLDLTFLIACLHNEFHNLNNLDNSYLKSPHACHACQIKLLKEEI